MNPKIRKLDTTADQKILMELAFSSLTNVNELALAVDSGLGYLESFDKSDRAKLVTGKAEVFGRRFALSKEDEILRWVEGGSSASARFSLRDKLIYDSYIELFRQVSGLRDTLVDLVEDYIFENPRGVLAELTAIQIPFHVMSVMLRAGILQPGQSPRQWSTAQDLILAACTTDMNAFATSLRTLPAGTADLDQVDTQTFPDDDGLHNTEIWNDHNTRHLRDLDHGLLVRLFRRPAGVPPPLIFDGLDIDDPIHPLVSEQAYTTKLLTPRNLSLAQKQWLAETGWVQQTFMTSYITSIVKNKVNFATVRSFTLAKLSSHYLQYLHDPELWAALCHIENLTILVSPDWRQIDFAHEGEFTSMSVAPSHACSALIGLLNFLSSISTIKSLKTGFVGGGEHAVGMFARNQHILPGPITNEERSTGYIVMPFIENITFVNCWFVPSILIAFLTDMISLKLRTVHFESVSLLVAGGKTISFPSTWPSNLPEELLADPGTGATPPFYIGFGVPQPGVFATIPQSQATPSYVRPHPPTVNGYAVPVSWRDQQVHRNTWAEIIEAVAPTRTLREKCAALVGQAVNPSSHVKQKTLSSLEFTSCGYAKLGYQALGPVLDDDSLELDRESALGRRKRQIWVYMMVSTDPFLGEIVPKLIHPELAILTGAFGMTAGPGNDPGRLENREDGKPDRGTGRFSGKIVRA